jgi:hypothetical protein
MFQNRERALFSLPRPSSLHSPSLQPEIDLYSNKPPNLLPRAPFTSYPFLFFLFLQCRWETETIVALRHCVPRRRRSASNPSSPRSTANTIPSYMLAASLSSPVVPVGSVVLPHASWPGEHFSTIHFLRIPFQPTVTFFLMFWGGGGACASCDAHPEITWDVVSCLRAPHSPHIVLGFPIHQDRSSPPFCLELS